MCKSILLEFDGGADSLELLLELFGLVLGDSFLQDSGHALDLCLRLGIGRKQSPLFSLVSIRCSNVSRYPSPSFTNTEPL